MNLSIVIPAYNEEKSIKGTVEILTDELDRQPIEYEVLVVCDGNSDRTHEAAVSIGHQKVRVYRYQPNQGKGFALKFGSLKANGDLVCFYDAGGDYSPDQVVFFYHLMKNTDIDGVIGSKRHIGSVVDYPKIRRLYSFTYQVLVRLLFGLNIRDTQVGLKIFRAEVLRRVLPRVLVKRYAFDLELLVVAKTLGHRKIIEAPVKMDFNQMATGITLLTIRNMLKDTLAIFWRDRILRDYSRRFPDKGIPAADAATGIEVTIGD